MRESRCLLLLPALLYPSAEISRNLGRNITSIINHFGTDDVGAGGKASHFYQKWNTTLSNTRNLPGVSPPSSQTTVGFNWDEIQCFPTARRCHRGLMSLDSPESHSVLLLSSFSCSPVPLLLTLLKQWIFGFLSNKTGKSVLRASSALQNPQI